MKTRNKILAIVGALVAVLIAVGFVVGNSKDAHDGRAVRHAVEKVQKSHDSNTVANPAGDVKYTLTVVKHPAADGLGAYTTDAVDYTVTNSGSGAAAYLISADVVGPDGKTITSVTSEATPDAGATVKGETDVYPAENPAGTHLEHVHVERDALYG